jgi:hypothetical protein
MEWTPEMTQAALDGTKCRESGHPPKRIALDSAGRPVSGKCDCGTYAWFPQLRRPAPEE